MMQNYFNYWQLPSTSRPWELKIHCFLLLFPKYDISTAHGSGVCWFIKGKVVRPSGSKADPCNLQ